MSRRLNLTNARKSALVVLADAEAQKRLVRVSNVTEHPTPVHDGKVYWQTADWLIKERLVDHSAVSQTLTLTDEGAVLATSLTVGVSGVTS